MEDELIAMLKLCPDAAALVGRLLSEHEHGAFARHR